MRVASSARELAGALQREGVAASAVMDARALFDDPHLRARHCFEGIDHPAIGAMLFDRTPIRTLPDEPCEARPSP